MMCSVPQVRHLLKQLFEEDAPRLAREAGLRQRSLSFTQLALLLVLGWWTQPSRGPSALSRFAGSLGVTLSKQAVDAHWTEHTAAWLLALLRAAVWYLVQANGTSLSWMDRFEAIWVEDGSTISLPEGLASVWQGCGGTQPKPGHATRTASALKVTLRLDLKGGGWQGPQVQAGRQHEAKSALAAEPMRRGSVWLADLGYWSLMRMKSLIEQGVYFCLRLKRRTVLWYQQEQTEVSSLLAHLDATTLQAEWRVSVGASQFVKDVRLLAQRVPAEVAAQRRERLAEEASKKGKAVSAQAMELADWTLLVTNLPPSLVSVEQAFVLVRARWQIELVFKLWKQQALVDAWTSEKPWRILCEVYGKLLAMLLQHWLTLLACQDDPEFCEATVAQVLREQGSLLVKGLSGRLPLGRAIRLVVESVRGGCATETRSTRLSTSRLIQSAFGLPLT